MSAAVRCLKSVQEAIAAARESQEKMNRAGSNHFDRMAINSAVEHLERALNELACFAPKEVIRRSRLLD